VSESCSNDHKGLKDGHHCVICGYRDEKCTEGFAGLHTYDAFSNECFHCGEPKPEEDTHQPVTPEEVVKVDERECGSEERPHRRLGNKCINCGADYEVKVDECMASLDRKHHYSSYNNRCLNCGCDGRSHIPATPEEVVKVNESECGSEDSPHVFDSDYGHKCSRCGMDSDDFFENDTEIKESPRGTILDKAKSLITGDRPAEHGEFSDNVTKLGMFMTGLTGKEYTRHECRSFFIALKLCRVQGDKFGSDSLVDLCGYADLINEDQEKQAGNP